MEKCPDLGINNGELPDISTGELGVCAIILAKTPLIVPRCVVEYGEICPFVPDRLSINQKTDKYPNSTAREDQVVLEPTRVSYLQIVKKRP